MKKRTRHYLDPSWLFAVVFSYLLLIGSQTVSAQTFERLYGSPDFAEGGTCMLPINSDTLVLGGYRADSAVLIFVNPQGDILFERSFKFTNSTHLDLLSDIKLDTDGMIYGAGSGRGLSPNRGFAFRYDYITDNLEWSVEFNDILPNSTHSFGFAVEQPKLGGSYLVLGQSSNTSSDNAYCVELNKNTGYATSPVNYIYDIGSSETFATSLLISGATGTRLFTAGRFTVGGSASQMRASIAELETDADLVGASSFFQTPNGTARQYATDLVFNDNTGTLAMSSGGDRNGISGTVTTCNLSSHDLSRNLIWGMEYQFPTYQTEYLWEVIPVSDGYVALGSNRGLSPTIFLLKTDLSGNPLWSYEYGASALYGLAGFGQAQLIEYNGSLYFLGEVRGIGDPDLADIVLFRVNMDGSLDTDCQSTLVPTTTPYFIGYQVPMVQSPSGIRMDSTNRPFNDPALMDSILCSNADCSAATDSNYQKITGAITITSDESWTGKYFVSSGVVITVDNATLDLTNVDIVFEECAGINFVNGAMVRANNSVFRPCNQQGTWKGFTFSGESGGVVHECTFKNAQRAIAIFNSGANQTSHASIKISGNHLVDNRWGIYSSNTILDDAITGNHFLITGADIDYEPDSCLNVLYSNNHYGIQGFRTKFEGLISQNEFVNATTAPKYKEFHGIYAIQSSGTASLNTFSNMYSAVEMSTASFFTVENNHIELTREFLGNQSQIRVSSNSSWIQITGNHVVNSNDGNLAFIANSGIYAEDAVFVNIKENIIEGFWTGIHLHDLAASHIGENEISNSQRVGIYIEGGTRLDITCNKISPRFRQNTVTAGIYYLKSVSIPETNVIRNNCIRDGSYGILTLATSGPATSLPTITNNFFYNYSRFGIYNIGFSGGIGTSIANFSTSGRNTFVSNNIPNGALDIFSNLPIVAAGNYGISSISANVTVLGNGLYNSTASCASQIGTISQQITGEEACDNFTDAIFVGLRLLNRSTAGLGDLLEKEELHTRYIFAQAWLAKMHHEQFYTQEAALLDNILLGDLLNSDEKALLQCAFYARRGEEVALENAVASISGSTPEYQTAKAVWTIQNALTSSKRGLHELTSAELMILESVSGKENPSGDLAWDYLQGGSGNHLFRYHEATLPEIETPERRILLEDGGLEVYPNPTDGKLTIEYYLEDAHDTRIQLFDIQGRMLFDQEVVANGKQIEIDLASYQSGLYFVSLVDASGRLSWKKVVRI